MDVSRPIPDNQVLKVEPALPGLELSARINAVLGRLRDLRGNYPTCFVVRQGAQALVAALCGRWGRLRDLRCACPTRFVACVRVHRPGHLG